jgi:HSP20 family molecular chaperone IbpA
MITLMKPHYASWLNGVLEYMDLGKLISNHLQPLDRAKSLCSVAEDEKSYQLKFSMPLKVMKEEIEIHVSEYLMAISFNSDSQGTKNCSRKAWFHLFFSLPFDRAIDLKNIKVDCSEGTFHLSLFKM